MREMVVGAEEPRKTCNYGTMAASIMRDQLVIGVADAGTQEKVLSKKTWTWTRQLKFSGLVSWPSLAENT